MGEYYWDQKSVVGRFYAIHYPEKTFSVLEPHTAGGCDDNVRATVANTSANYQQSCILATNAGFYDIHNGSCMGETTLLVVGFKCWM